jgi:hypothetical protein
MAKQNDLQQTIGMVKRILLFCLLSFSPLLSGAQGLPLIRNYTAAEYGGHNRC